MAMGNIAASPLQRALQKQQTPSMQLHGIPNALSGIDMFKNMSEQNIQNGLTNAQTGNLNIPTHASMGYQFGQGTGNPWESFIAQQESTNERNDNSLGQLMTNKPKNTGLMGIRGFAF